MGETTGINYCDSPGRPGATWNPWTGCLPVSAGCAHCYMVREQRRFGKDPSVVVRASDATFYAPLKKWKEPRTILAPSWSDFWIEEADEWRDEAWRVIRQTPWHRYLIVTKRPERIDACLPDDWGQPSFGHVWLGVSIEDADAWGRWAALARSRALAGRRWISFEPLIGEIQEPLLRKADAWPDWVVIGCESGSAARPMWYYWVTDLIAAVCTSRPGTFIWLKQIRTGQYRLGRLVTDADEITAALRQRCPRERPWP